MPTREKESVCATLNSLFPHCVQTPDWPNYFHGISLSDLAHILWLQDDMWAGKADTIK